ncbi:hypothetical protein J3R30DRAFT_3244466, partial [Lentinula aciculospora]
LPIELIEEIIISFWSQPQSTHHRAMFIKSSLAVSHMWATIFTNVFFRDVHIPSGQFALKFLEILRNQPSVFDSFTDNRTLLNRRCRSLTFQRDTDDVILKSIAPESSRSSSILVQGLFNKTSKAENPMSLAIFSVLQFLYYSSSLPNLRRISILYNNSTLSDLFTRNKFIGFPTQVKELEIRFTYNVRTPKRVLEQIKQDESAISLVPGSLVNVKVLRATGLSKAAERELMEACYNREEVEMD